MTTKPWIDSPDCKNHVAHGFVPCLFCRTVGKWQDRQEQRGWQNPREAACPEGFALWETPLPLALAQQQEAEVEKPPVTVAKVASFAEAVLTSPRVSPEVEAERLSICDRCEHRKVPSDGTPPFCGLCGCKVSKEGWQVRNLAHYEENLPKWGCKHPQRGWVRPDGTTAGWPLLHSKP